MLKKCLLLSSTHYNIIYMHGYQNMQMNQCTLNTWKTDRVLDCIKRSEHCSYSELYNETQTLLWEHFTSEGKQEQFWETASLLLISPPSTNI